MTVRSKITISLAFIVVLFTGAPLYAAMHELGVLGQTYPLAERDALNEIKERVSQVDWHSVFSRKKIEKAIEDYRPDTTALPRARTTRTRLVDMTYTLPFDIPDGKGGILYPRGYTFNPLDYIHFDKTVVVIDGSDPEQVGWFLNSPYSEDIRTMLLLTKGSYFELGKKLDRPVFYATTDIVHRFQLQAVPSVIHQEGRYMEVEEIDIAGKESK